MRNVPDDNLAYPVLISLSSGSSGSAFYLNYNDALFLITARHCLYSPDGILLSKDGILVSYGTDPKDSTSTQIQIDFANLNNNGHVYRHPTSDVAAVKLATRGTADENGLTPLEFYEGVHVLSMSNSNMVGVDAISSVKRFSDVLVSNDVFLFGYPSSIGLKQSAQFDYARPLLRRGIISGKYEAQKTIILDCAAYYGNSGGPVIEMEQEGPTYKYKVCGVVSEFIPYVESWVNNMAGIENIEVSNSGYSVAVSMDPVFELIGIT